MTLLFVLLTLLVIGVVGAVAAGRITGGLAEPVSSLPRAGLEPGPVSASAVHDVRFNVGLRGYRMVEVDDVLDRVAGELAQAQLQLEQDRAEIARLRQVADGLRAQVAHLGGPPPEDPGQPREQAL